MNASLNASALCAPLHAPLPAAGSDVCPPWPCGIDRDDDLSLDADDDHEWRAFLALALRTSAEALSAGAGWRQPPALLMY